MKTIFGWTCLLMALLPMCACTTVAVNTRELHRLEDVRALPKNARIGITEFTVCGGNYLEKLKPEYLEQDEKAQSFRACTEQGNPQIFSARVRQRLEEKLGRRLVLVSTEKSFKPKQVVHDAEKLGLEYVIAGDLLYMGERDNKSVVSVLFYLIRVADGKNVVVGRAKKDGGRDKLLSLVDDVADELFDKTYDY